MFKASKRFNKFRGTATGALIMASVLTLTSMDATAAIVYSGPLNIAVPATTTGVYINFVTGATGTSAGAVPGWNFNPYNTASGLGFYWSPTLAGGLRGAVVQGATLNQAANLPVGTVVSAASVFTSAIQSANPVFRTTLTGAYLGVRFVNSATGVMNFGWVQINTTAATGFPATIVSYAYENTGQQITVGTTPVELQTFSVD